MQFYATYVLEIFDQIHVIPFIQPFENRQQNLKNRFPEIIIARTLSISSRRERRRWQISPGPFLWKNARAFSLGWLEILEITLRALTIETELRVTPPAHKNLRREKNSIYTKYSENQSSDLKNRQNFPAPTAGPIKKNFRA